MIGKIEISNYRSFKNLSVDGLARVNLIAGKNNAGKTNFLEAVFTACDAARDLQPADFFTFHNGDAERPAVIKINDDGDVRRVAIHADHVQREPAQKRAGYITSETSAIADAAIVFSEIRETGKSEKILDFAKRVDPSVKDLYVSATPQGAALVCDAGLPRSVPLQKMGNGFARSVSIVLCIMRYEGAVVLVDEIDRGIHHSEFEKTWSAIMSLLRESECQMFATTHSAECIAGAVDAARALKMKNADFSFFRLRRHRKLSEAVAYPLDNLNDDTLMNWELR